MKKIFFTPLFIFLALTSFSAMAQKSSGGLYVEPGITYEVGDGDIDWPSPFTNSTGDINGFGVMARVGFHLSESFFAAIDGRYKVVKFENSSNDYSANATGYNLAPVVGIQMPNVGLRVWGSYILMGTLDPESSNSTDVKFEDAKGTRIGVGFHIYSMSLNLEYQNIEYGKTTLEEIGPFSSSAESDSINLTNKSYIVSLSFPIEI